MPSRRREKGRKSWPGRACSVASEMDNEVLERENEALFEEMYGFVGVGSSALEEREVEEERPLESERKASRRRRRAWRENRGGEGVLEGDRETRETERVRECPSQGELEMKKLRDKLNEMGLEIYNIRPNGNCLYNSIAQQLVFNGKSIGEEVTSSVLRRMTAEELRRNSGDYIPYLDDSLGFDAYCDRVESDQSMWGGQLEIRALCRLLEVPIWVVSADAPAVEMGTEYLDGENRPLVLVFHRHLLASGCHYNGVRSSVSE